MNRTGRKNASVVSLPRDSVTFSRERFGVSLFVAAIVHIVIVLGLSFVVISQANERNVLDVTLAYYDDQEEPEEADFLAQANQLGSGDRDKAAKPTVTEQPLYDDVEVHEVTQPAPQPIPEPTPPAAQPEQVARQVERPAPAQQTEPEQQAELEPTQKKSVMAKSLELASLQAIRAEQVQRYAKRPRVGRITSAATRSTVGAYYQEAWRQKVERIGNMNFPTYAKQNHIYGKVVTMVALYPDGSVKEVQIMQSSGHKVLDDAAITTVRRAEPFAPFPEDLRAKYDILEIIRTWSFQKRGLLSY